MNRGFLLLALIPSGRTQLLAVLSVAACITLPPECVTAKPPEPTKVVRVNPRDKATGVDVRASVQLHFSNGLKLATLTADCRPPPRSPPATLYRPSSVPTSRATW